jgi:transcriptional regulator with XRE-family HTH domain
MNRSTRGDRLAEAMALRGWRKHAALAKALGVNGSTVWRWRNNGPLSLDHAVAVCDILDVSLDWLLLGRGSLDAWDQRSLEGELLRERARAALSAFTAALPELFGAVAERG